MSHMTQYARIRYPGIFGCILAVLIGCEESERDQDAPMCRLSDSPSGGSVSTGGRIAVGGATPTGGLMAVAGSIGAGGTAAVNISTSIAGAAAGLPTTAGMTSVGGTASAGRNQTNGSPPVAGTSNGGAIATAGSTSTGGVKATGGTLSTGGTAVMAPCNCAPYISGSAFAGTAGSMGIDGGNAGSAGTPTTGTGGTSLKNLPVVYEAWVKSDRSDLITGQLKQLASTYSPVLGVTSSYWGLNQLSRFEFSQGGISTQILATAVACGKTDFILGSPSVITLFLIDGSTLTGTFAASTLVEGDLRSIVISGPGDRPSQDAHICFRSLAD